MSVLESGANAGAGTNALANASGQVPLNLLSMPPIFNQQLLESLQLSNSQGG